MNFERVEIGPATLYLGDCREVLADLGTFDVVITDPPYGINGSTGTINKARSKGEYGGGFSDTAENIRDNVAPLIAGLIPKAICVIVTPGNRCFGFYPQPDSFGCFFQPAAVGLQTFGNLDAQPIFYYGKNPTKKNLGVPLSYQLTESPEKNGHPCVKPIRAWQMLVSKMSLVGHVVLDPFMGSGTTGVACINLGRRFIGIEQDPAYFEIARKRIAHAVEQSRQRLFDPEPEPEPNQPDLGLESAG